MGRNQDELESSGLKVVAVGIGQPNHAEFFCGRLAPRVTCLTHETILVHRQFGIGYGESKDYYSVKFAGYVARAVSRGNMQGLPTTGTEGYGLLTANLIVDKSGIIRFAHYSEVVGDNPDLQEVMNIGRELSKA